MITVEQLEDAFKRQGKSMLYLTGESKTRLPHTAGTLSFESIIAAVNLALERPELTEDEALVLARAQEKFAMDDDVAIYDDARVSEAGDEGDWVQASVYIRREA